MADDPKVLAALMQALTDTEHQIVFDCRTSEHPSSYSRDCVIEGIRMGANGGYQVRVMRGGDGSWRATAALLDRDARALHGHTFELPPFVRPEMLRRELERLWRGSE